VRTQRRIWDAGRCIDVPGTLGPLRRGAGDPAHRLDAGGRFWWACDTPTGSGTLLITPASRTAVEARAWGEGAQWLLERVPALLGAVDDWSGLDLTGQAPVAHVLRGRPGLRLTATGLVFDSLVPAVLEQRVTGHEARRAWAALLRWYGTPAPGPAGDAGMCVPPGARAVLDVTSWDWHRAGVDAQRQRALRAAASVAVRLEECVGMAPSAAAQRLRGVPGIGVWTAAETLQRATGDPDIVSVGDYHLKDVVVHFFTGRPRGEDAEMLELLEPWRGQRQRIVRLIELAGVGKPRFGPRYAPLDLRAI
jgi:3-methyladenine DNA glycosylase/8-oxoguanine DNA glycosylase